MGCGQPTRSRAVGASGAPSSSAASMRSSSCRRRSGRYSAPPAANSAGAGCGASFGTVQRAQHAQPSAGRCRRRRRDRAARRRAPGCGPAAAGSRPVDAAVFGLAAAEVAAGGEVLRHVRRRAGDAAPAARGRAPSRRPRVTLSNTSRGGVVGQDGHRLLGDDLAGVGLLDHVVQRGAGLALAVQHRPVHRHPAAVLAAAASRACCRRRAAASASSGGFSMWR